MSMIIPLLDGLRRNIQHWINTTEPLKSDCSAGDTILHVRSTRRIKAGDQFMMKNGDEDTETFLNIEEVIDDTHLRLTEPMVLDWYVSDGAAITRTFYGNFFKAIWLGEPDVIRTDMLPCVSVWATSKSSEPLAIRTFKERYNIEIAVYVSDADLEGGVRILGDSIGLIERGLKKNLYPLVDDYSTTSLIANVSEGDTYLKVADSSIMRELHVLLLEDELDTQELVIHNIVDANTICVGGPAMKNFNKEDTTIILPRRFIYNSWPAEINFNKIHKGTLLKAGVINFFAEEAEDQFVSSWFDTQLK